MHAFAKKPKATLQNTSAKPPKSSRAFVRQSQNVHSILHLQRTIGNQATQQLLKTRAKSDEETSALTNSIGFSHELSRIPEHTVANSNVQAKLKVSTPADKFEQEADQVAEQVVHRKNAESSPQTPVTLSNHVAHSNSGSDNATPVDDAIRGALHNGRPLTPEERTFFEPRMGGDFRGVRIHENTIAMDSAKALNARAYTYGQHIVMGRGEYGFSSDRGKKLMAHELTHVMQNGESDVVHRTPLAAMGAAEWIAAAGLGFTVANEAVKNTSGDITWKLDEANGVLLPGGRTDVQEYQRENPNITIHRKELIVSFWRGNVLRYSSSRRAGIKFGLTFLTDGKGIGNISARIIDTYDWVSWGANCRVDLMPETFVSENGKAVVRVTLTNSWVFNYLGIDFSDGVDSEIWHLEGDGSFTRFRNSDMGVEHRLT
jgi:hypothetical protein